MKAKLDTGARTSALHVDEIEEFRRRGADWVRFQIPPRRADQGSAISAEARVVDERFIRSSNGQGERRIVVTTELLAGGETWPIELSLSRRGDMTFRLLLGRQALAGRLLVDVAHSYLLGRIARPA